MLLLLSVIESAGCVDPPRLLQVPFFPSSFQYPKVERRLFLPDPFSWHVIFSAAVETTAFHKAAKWQQQEKSGPFFKFFFKFMPPK